MTDIVERLRDPMARMSTAVGGGAVALCIEAADEIERLQKHAAINESFMQRQRDELRAEIERLREKLGENDGRKTG